MSFTKDLPLKLNIQFFAETNTIVVPDMATVRATDFVRRYGKDISKTVEALGITNRIGMAKGNEIQTYKFVITPPADPAAAAGNVPEAEDIPLTRVQKVPDQKYSLTLKKFRKAVSAEEVQRVGYDAASNQSDREVLNHISKTVRSGFFSFLGTAPTDLGATENLQKAAAKIWGNVENVFDGASNEAIMFVNPLDAAEYLGASTIENGQSVGFGLTLLKGFTNVRILINNSVPVGTYYGTAVENLNFAYPDANGEIKQMYTDKQTFVDKDGTMLLVKEGVLRNATEQATIFTGATFFAEVSNGVFKGTLPTAAPVV